MKLRGHKSACKCVGCSPATRKRGMARLRAYMKNKPRRKRGVSEQLDRDRKAAVKKIVRSVKRRLKSKKVYRANPKRTHRPNCKCVACSPATRARGMAAIRRLQRPARRVIKRHKNPARKFIGSNVTVHTSRGVYRVGGMVFAGPGIREVTITGAGTRRLPLNASVRCIDYDNRAKALRSYGKPGRFYHNFKTAVRVHSSSNRGSGEVVLLSQSPLWRAQ